MNDLDTLRTQFKSKDDSVLGYLIVLEEADDYVPGTSAQARAFIHATKVTVGRAKPKAAAAADASYINHNIM